MKVEGELTRFCSADNVLHCWAILLMTSFSRISESKLEKNILLSV